MAAPPLCEAESEGLLSKACRGLLVGDERVRASVVKERMIELSAGQFGRLQYTDPSFSKFLSRYPGRLVVEKDGTTTYVRRAAQPIAPRPELFRRYRSALKKQKLRIVPPRTRLVILKDLIEILQQHDNLEWRDLVDRLAALHPGEEDAEASRNMINAIIVLARRGGVVRTLKGRTLATAPVLLALEGERIYQESVIRCDMAYLEAIRSLAEPFDLEEAALALYDQASYAPYLKHLLSRMEAERQNEVV